MGLMICLSGAPWGGAEIDDVNRVGRALRDKVGDDDAWFEEWTRMGDKIEAQGRVAEREGHKLTAASCFLRATRYYQTGERFLQPKSQRGMDVYAKSVKTFRDAAALIRSPRIEHVEIPYQGTSLPALLVHPGSRGGGRPSGAGHGLFRRLRRHQGDPVRLRGARPRGARRRLPDRRRTGQRRERALPQSAADRRDRTLRHAGLRVSRRPARVRSKSASA